MYWDNSVEIIREQPQIPEEMTLTTNGQLAYAPGHFLKDEESSLAALNIAITVKDDFQNAKQYLDRIFEGKNKLLKTYAMVLMIHVRDIDQGKGLRKPFLESLVYFYKLGYKSFVCELVEQIPEYGYYKDLCNLYKLAEDREYHFLMNTIIEVYINALNKEHEAKEGRGLNNSGKFAPRQQKKFHTFYLALSKAMFPNSKTAQKDYRKYIGEIMGKYKQVTEVLMSSKKWDEIDPKYVPSLCFQRYKKCFLKTEKDDEKRKLLKEKYEKHILDALENKNGAKINAKRLTIDKIAEEMYNNMRRNNSTELEANAREAQFLDIVNDLKKNAKFLKNCVAICDVSGSMHGNPLNACIGLGIALHELNSGKYSHNILTFSAEPVWVEIGDGMTFQEKVKAVATSQWGMNTDFFKAMKKVAELADKKEDLPQAMFVFSDMQFDRCGGSGWTTTYEKIADFYKAKGFEEKDIPTIIFWNLRGGANNFVVDTNQKKVICISGFSQNLIKAISQAPDMDYIMNLSPFTFLIDVLDSKRYEPVKKIAMRNI